MSAVAQAFLICFSVSVLLRQSHVDNKYGFLSLAGPVLVWLQPHCQSALCLWCVDVFWSRWALTVGRLSVVSSWGGSGVRGFRGRV